MADRLALADGTSLLLLVNGVDHLLLTGGVETPDNATSDLTDNRTNPSVLTITSTTSTPTDSDG